MISPLTDQELMWLMSNEDKEGYCHDILAFGQGAARTFYDSEGNIYSAKWVPITEIHEENTL